MLNVLTDRSPKPNDAVAPHCDVLLGQVASLELLVPRHEPAGGADDAPPRESIRMRENPTDRACGPWVTDKRGDVCIADHLTCRKSGDRPAHCISETRASVADPVFDALTVR